MLKITSAQREDILMPKPNHLSVLAEKISWVYEVQLSQLLLTYENDEEEQTLLMNEEEYKGILRATRDFSVAVYISPLPKRPKIARILIASLVLTYVLMKYATIRSISVSLSGNSEYLFDVFIDIFYVIWFLTAWILQGSVLVPVLCSIGQWMYLVGHWTKHFWEKKTIHKSKIVYIAILALNLLPNVIGYASSMVVIIWQVLVYVHVVLHRSKPRCDRDKKFMKTLSLMILCEIPRLIYYY
jgi:hypothetical protein